MRITYLGWLGNRLCSIGTGITVTNMMHHVATMYDTVKEMHINIEVSNLLTSLIDIVVDAENKAIVVDLTTNLQLLQQEQNDTTETVQKLQEERTTYMKEATLLRDQLVHDYRNMLGQLDESRRQLAERPTTNITNIMAATPSSSQQQQQQQQQHSFPAPPPYIAQAPVQLQQPPLQPPPPDLPFRRLMLAPHANPGRIVKKILSYFDATDIYVLSDTAGFYTHLINWVFEESPTPPPLLDQVRTIVTPPPPFTPEQSQPPPPPYTPTPQHQRQPQKQENNGRANRSNSNNNSNNTNSNSNSKQTRSANRLKKADALSKSLSRRELKEVSKLGARCKSLEKNVMILQNEKDDLSSQADASANVKQFLLEKIQALEDKAERLQNQTDNDQQIISFLDSSIEKKEQEKNEWKIERDTYEIQKLKWSEDLQTHEKKSTDLLKTIDQLKSQKKVLVQEVKRMRKQRSNSSGTLT